MNLPVRIRYLGRSEYTGVHADMERFTLERDGDTVDELWVVEHPPVYTQGRAGRPEHILNPAAIDVIQTGRGGQVTYHGPGQIVVYFLLDIGRRKLGVRDLVTRIENAMIRVLADYQINACSERDAPGVYVQGEKIGAIGLRVTKGRTYHGLSFNVDMDLEPFTHINPCGHVGMKVTHLAALGVHEKMPQVAHRLVGKLLIELEYSAKSL